MEKEKALSKVPLFSRLDARHIRDLAGICVEKRFASGDTIIEQGKTGVGLFVVVEGHADVIRKDTDGHTAKVAHCGPGEVLGEMAVLDGAPRSASVVAVEATTCLVLAAWEFTAFMKANPVIALEILPMVVKRYREAAGSTYTH